MDDIWDWRESTVYRVLYLNMIDQGSNLSFWKAKPGVIPEIKARSNLSALEGVSQNYKNK